MRHRPFEVVCGKLYISVYLLIILNKIFLLFNFVSSFLILQRHQVAASYNGQKRRFTLSKQL